MERVQLIKNGESKMADDVIMTSLLLLKIAKTFQLGMTCESYKKKRVFWEIIQTFFFAPFHSFNDLCFIQNIVLSVFNYYRVKKCNFLTLLLGCHGKGFVLLVVLEPKNGCFGGQNILLQLYRKGK